MSEKARPPTAPAMASRDVSGCPMEPPDPPVSQPIAAPITDAINGPMVVTTTRSGDVSAIGSPAPASHLLERVVIPLSSAQSLISRRQAGIQPQGERD